MKKTYPAAAILSVIIIVAIEIVFFFKTEPLTGAPYLQPTADDAVVVAKRALSSDAANKIVIVGDSSSLYGIRPKDVLDQTGMDLINLGTLASLTMIGYCDMAARLLNSPNKPKAIILAVLPQTMEQDERQAREMGQIGRYLIAYGSEIPSSYNLNFRDYISWFEKKHRFNIFPPQFGGSYNNFESQLRLESGFLPEQTNKINYSRTIDTFSASNMSALALKELEKVAAFHGIPLLFAFNPKPKSLASKQYIEETNAYLKSLKKEKGHLLNLTTESLFWDDIYFGTETHLNEKGVKKYSGYLSRMLAEKLPLDAPEKL